MRKLLVALIAAFTLAAPSVALAQAQPSGGTFSLPITDDPPIWPLTGGLFNILVNKSLYSTLFRYDLDTLEPVGDLVDTWEVSEDGLTYTLNLRQNVTWHDGEPFTSSDVAFTLGLWLDPEVPFFLRNNFRLIETVSAPDDFTVVITMSKPQASFPSLLAYLANMLPEHLLSDLTPQQLTNPTEFLRNPIGTGPFKFAQYQAGAFVRLERFDDYFAGTPNLDALVYRIVPDANSQLALLQSGELDLVVIEAFQLEAIENNPNVQIQSVPIVRHEFVSINGSLPGLSDPVVRRALTLSLDRGQLLEAVFRGRGELATGPFPPSMGWAHNDAIEPLPFDPEEAARILDEAGWELGADGVRAKDDVRLSFTVLYDPANPTRARTALVAQQYWAEIGIETDFETSDYGPIVSRIRSEPPEYELNPNYLITPPDPDGVANYYLSESRVNSWVFCNAEVDELFSVGATAGDRETRQAAYHRVQEIMHEEQPNVFTVYPYEIQALSQSVASFPQAGFRDALAWAHLIEKR